MSSSSRRGPLPPARSPNGLGVRIAFTLLELLVVIAIISILALLVSTALGSAKAAGRKAECLNTKRQLALALHLYADDWNERLPYNEWDGFGAWGAKNWISARPSWKLHDLSTNLVYVTSDEYSSLAKYVGHSARVFRCPADRFLSPAEKRAGVEARIASIALNGWVGYKRLDPPINPMAFRRLSDFSRLGPANVWTFIDEHPDWLANPFFWMYPDGLWWTDVPASYHRGGAVLAFADGHAQLKMWQDAETKQPVTFGANDSFRYTGTNDWDWLQRGGHDPTLFRLDHLP